MPAAFLRTWQIRRPVELDAYRTWATTWYRPSSGTTILLLLLELSCIAPVESYVSDWSASTVMVALVWLASVEW